jgi:enolase
LDGTPNKSRLGGNATIAVSMATLHASAAAHHEPLWRYLSQNNNVSVPLPEIQIFGGGDHAGNRVDVQDFMIVCSSARSFSETLEMTSSVYRCAAQFLSDRGLLQGVADEGGLWPAFNSNTAVLDALVRAIEDAGYVPGSDISISLDMAASQLRDGNLYRLRCDNKAFGKDEWIDLLGSWIDRYPIVSIEDPLAEDDTGGFIEFTRLFGTHVQIVGDDYLVTNAARVRQAAADGACNAALIKPNQAGTITETYAALKAAKDAGFRTIISARSGETEDVTIAHLAVGWNAGQLKVGSFSRSERMAKWNEVLRIDECITSQDDSRALIS